MSISGSSGAPTPATIAIWAHRRQSRLRGRPRRPGRMVAEIETGRLLRRPRLRRSAAPVWGQAGRRRVWVPMWPSSECHDRASIPFLVHTEAQVNRPGKNLIHKTISLAVAILTGKRVSDNRVRRRIELCARCRYVRVRRRRGQRLLRCGICGCRLHGRRALVNLARYEETRRYGCKHPGGSRWRKAGV